MITVEMANLEMMIGDLLGVLINRRQDIAHAIYFTPKAVLARIEVVEAVADIIHAPPSRTSPKGKRLYCAGESFHGQTEQIYSRCLGNAR
jgi:hypothetical protein